MSGRIAFLRRCLDEDERVARAATPGPWWHNPGKVWLGPDAFEAYDRSKGEEFVGYGESPYSGCVAATGPASHAQAMNDAQHIARHDPARALAEVDAKRKILDGIERRLDPREPDGGWEAADAETDGMASAVLGLLTQPYAGRDGWREEWRA